MNAVDVVNGSDHEEITAWLRRALHGQEALPRLSSDEPPYHGILRVEKRLKPAARDSLREACLLLVREFCAEGSGDPLYTKELLGLVSALGNPESVELLSGLATGFPQLPGLSLEVRLCVLATLADTPPPRDMAFWEEVLRQDPENYAGMALSGVLAANPEQAVAMLPRLPDSERLGEAAALKLELAWDNLPPKERFQFVEDVQAILLSCGRRFSGPVQAWADSKGGPHWVSVSPTLAAGIISILGAESPPRTRTPRLCPCA